MPRNLYSHLHGILCVAILWVAVAVTAGVLIIPPMGIVVLILLIVLVIAIVVHLIVLYHLQPITWKRNKGGK